MTSCGREESATDPGFVTVYCSVDDSQARPIAALFRERTGMDVRMVSDTEETKSTGLLNRLMAERKRPWADVFWSGDIARAALLKSRGISAPYESPQRPGLRGEWSDPEHHFTGFASRLRVLIYNRRLVTNSPPTSVYDLIHPRYQGRACMANPLFGTTGMHAAALYQHLNKDGAELFFRQLITNQVRMLSSNGEVRRRVAAGDYAVGLTDSDDVSVALRDGADVGFAIPDQHEGGMGVVLVPSAVVLIQGGPHPDAGRRFVDFLLSSEVENLLAAGEAAFVPLREGLAPPPLFGISISKLRIMNLNVHKLGLDLESLSSGFLSEWVGIQGGAGQGR